MARLIWKKTDSPAEDQTFDLGEISLVVGRDPKCGIFMDTPLMSREHARIDFKDGGHVVTDLDSTNFTKVNGERVTEKPLKQGDEVRFSRAVCIYEA
ncbi:MAG: FHA domain-containing protein [Vicinamibacteria bacterium]